VAVTGEAGRPGAGADLEDSRPWALGGEGGTERNNELRQRHTKGPV
jgi:hypothetical protein